MTLAVRELPTVPLVAHLPGMDGLRALAVAFVWSTTSIPTGCRAVFCVVFPGMAVDAKESRQMSTAPAIIQDKFDQGDLGWVVILGLGTNGSFKARSWTTSRRRSARSDGWC